MSLTRVSCVVPPWMGGDCPNHPGPVMPLPGPKIPGELTMIRHPRLGEFVWEFGEGFSVYRDQDDRLVIRGSQLSRVLKQREEWGV